MFPLGTVLMPGMPIALRVFEHRYLEMMRDLVATENREFGVVLIERGNEIGGGDTRFNIGTIARIAALEPATSWLDLFGRGFERVEVVEWLPDDPYPKAHVRRLPQLPWSDANGPVLAQAETIVRQALARASEFADQRWSPDVTIPGEGAARAWRLAAIAPIEVIDRNNLLACTSTSELLDRLVAAVQEAEKSRML